MQVILDGTGMRVDGCGAWREKVYGESERRQWVKVHVALDGERGMGLSVEVTGSEVADAAVVPEVMAGVKERVREVIANGGMIGENSTEVNIVIPPGRGQRRGVKEHPRDENLRYIRRRGRKRWAMDGERGWKAKRILGESLRSRRRDSQTVEVKLRCAVLNQMRALGMPECVRVSEEGFLLSEPPYLCLAMGTQHLRNFCIIAHIDHGKSTLADRLLEHTGTLSRREMMDQVLDSMDLEREKGITIKSHPIQMKYQGYTLNLIDTPGHVDFSYEVSRAIAACEGALLVVDASQGIQAQTLANLYLALEQDLEIIPVLNKIDLPAARPDEVRDQVVELLGCKPEEVIYASAKEGIGIEAVLQAIIERIPPPPDRKDEPLRALIFDSQFDSYRGAIAYVRVKEGELRPGMRIRLMATGAEYAVEEVGIFRLRREPVESIPCGSVGYVVAGIKNIQEIKVGDTIADAQRPAPEPLKGFREMKPMVFAGFYPVDSSQFEDLREALEKLRLNDAAIQFEPETSAALGFGFRVGFLGLLHMEIVQERLSREFGMEVLATVPNVPYHAYLRTGEMVIVTNPAQMPDPAKLDHLEEPFVRVQIITDAAYIGPLMELCISRRGIFKNQTYLSPTRVELVFEMPLAEVIFDFYDRLKSLSRGYASLDYELIGYRPSELVRMDILLNGDRVDALSCIIHRDKAYDWGRRLCQKLKDLIPRQQFEIAIQAAIYGRVIARETLKALRKDVTAKCYGGDITRKRKLLERQKEGKKRMRQLGSVEVPQEAFMAVLKIE